MSIFPDYVLNLNTTTEDVTTTTTIPKEYAWDFENNDFLLKDGKFQIVTGKKALKVWIWKALHTMKMTYSIYSDNYGHDLDSIVGQGLSNGVIQSEAKRLVWECLSINPHIIDIENFLASVDDDLLVINFMAITDQGEVPISV
ncbi:DUF2634 domain-containing protein [Clostridium sp. JS66]|uniref:DUF2634 domain-containing protein n=1 Tax=Clostridium sp. JS66 TaxID=3064705 RepID=UPI00298E3A28|nr:DUF2634 domain-containing protein [Clostridium sp. JS66]WPC40616.1 DUF2634 domain-containing protein [Clostridium sp. JS66]